MCRQSESESESKIFSLVMMTGHVTHGMVLYMHMMKDEQHRECGVGWGKKGNACGLRK